MDFISNSREKFTAIGDYVLWDTKRLESHLIGIIEKNGSQLFYGHRFYSYRYSHNCIVAYANELKLSASILIDCMGYSSPIVAANNAVSIFGYHHLFGRVIPLKKQIAPIAVDNVILSGRPSYLEVFPRSDGQANVVLIASAKETRAQKQLEEDFNFIVRGSHYRDYFDHLEGGDRLHGIVPIGKIRKTSLDRIVFFGEAGQVHPAASCTCLNKLLNQYKSVALSILNNVRSGQLREKDLKSAVVHMNSFSRKFHQNLFKQLATLRSDKGDKFVELLHCLDQKSLDDLIFGEISLSHFAQFENLVRVLKKKNFLWVKPFVKSVIM